MNRAEPTLFPPAPDATGAWCTGHRIGGFELQQALPRTGSARVYRAWDHGLARTVAVKEYLPAALVRRDEDGGLRAAGAAAAALFERGRHVFLDEARRLARCDHPALARVLHLLEAHGTAYCVMPWYAGRPALEIPLALGGPLPEPALRLWLVDLLGALDAWHQVGSFHGGVHPGKVLLLDDGHGLLLAPGAAAQVVQPHDERARPGAGFQPDEQLYPGGHRAPGPWTDFHALAAVARYCITGLLPPAPGQGPAEPLAATMERLFWDEPDVRYTPELLLALDTAMSPEITRRPQTAAQFKRWLTAEAVPVYAAPVPPTPVSAAPVSAAPVSAAPVSAAPVSAAPVSATPVSATPAPPAAEPPASAPIHVAEASPVAPPPKAPPPPPVEQAPPPPEDAPSTLEPSAPPRAPPAPPTPADGEVDAATAALIRQLIDDIPPVPTRPSRRAAPAGPAAADPPATAKPQAASPASAPTRAAEPVSLPGADPDARPMPASPPRLRDPRVVWAVAATAALLVAGAAAWQLWPGTTLNVNTDDLPALAPPRAAQPGPPLQPADSAPARVQSPPAAPGLPTPSGTARGPVPAPAPPARPRESGPRQACSPRTEFSLYRCMQQLCGQARWQKHAQCVAFRRTDTVE